MAKKSKNGDEQELPTADAAHNATVEPAEAPAPVEVVAGVDAEPAELGIKVISKGKQFCRAGYYFGKEPKVLPLKDLAPGVLERLQGEKNLVTEIVNL